MPDKMDEYFEWRDNIRRQPRTMTMGEYLAWAKGGGDAVSSSCSTAPGWSELTILLNTPPVIGRVG
jgi:hypothetical protein